MKTIALLFGVFLVSTFGFYNLFENNLEDKGNKPLENRENQNEEVLAVKLINELDVLEATEEKDSPETSVEKTRIEKQDNTVLGVKQKNEFNVLVEKDIIYTSDGLMLDVYYPDQDKFYSPVIIFLHGGGWKNGFKERFNEDYFDLIRSGYTVVSIQYSSSENFKYPKHLEDITSAINWIEENRENYLLDFQNINLLGTSSGAHLALLYSAQNPGKINKTVVLGPTTDFITFEEDLENYCKDCVKTVPDLIKEFLGCKPEYCFDLAKEASPIYYEYANEIKIVYTIEEDTVPTSQYEKLRGKENIEFIQVRGRHSEVLENYSNLVISLFLDFNF